MTAAMNDDMAKNSTASWWAADLAAYLADYHVLLMADYSDRKNLDSMIDYFVDYLAGY